MIIFLDEDAACKNWLAKRPHAVVVEGMRDRSGKRLILHAAGCSRFKHILGRKTATTHGRWAACASQREELIRWSLAEYGCEPKPCPICSTTAETSEDHHVTRLGRDILDFVLDVAVIHLEPDARPYHLTVADIAQCLRKTPQQLQGALEQLAEEGLVTLGASTGRGPRSGDRRSVYPTAGALATLEYYAARDRADVEAEIARLLVA